MDTFKLLPLILKYCPEDLWTKHRRMERAERFARVGQTESLLSDLATSWLQSSYGLQYEGLETTRKVVKTSFFLTCRFSTRRACPKQSPITNSMSWTLWATMKTLAFYTIWQQTTTQENDNSIGSAMMTIRIVWLDQSNRLSFEDRTYLPKTCLSSA